MYPIGLDSSIYPSSTKFPGHGLAAWGRPQGPGPGAWARPEQPGRGLGTLWKRYIWNYNTRYNTIRYDPILCNPILYSPILYTTGTGRITSIVELLSNMCPTFVELLSNFCRSHVGPCQLLSKFRQIFVDLRMLRGRKRFP